MLTLSARARTIGMNIAKTTTLANRQNPLAILAPATVPGKWPGRPPPWSGLKAKRVEFGIAAFPSGALAHEAVLGDAHAADACPGRLLRLVVSDGKAGVVHQDLVPERNHAHPHVDRAAVETPFRSQAQKGLARGPAPVNAVATGRDLRVDVVLVIAEGAEEHEIAVFGPGILDRRGMIKVEILRIALIGCQDALGCGPVPSSFAGKASERDWSARRLSATMDAVISYRRLHERTDRQKAEDEMLGIHRLLIAAAVLSSLPPAVDARSPAQVLCLMFDEGREGKQLGDGSRIQDACRRDRQGIVRGDPTWVAGKFAFGVRLADDCEKEEFSGPMRTRRAVAGSIRAPVQVGAAKRLFLDHSLIEKMEGVKLTMNRPRLTGEKSIIAEKPWEAGSVHPFGDSVMEDPAGTCRMYYPSWDKQGRLWFCMATSKDGVRWERPELGMVPFAGSTKTNIVYPDASCPKMAYFFGTCVFRDANPRCPPEHRYKMINGDAETWVFGSPDGIRFKPLYGQPSFRPSDTNNILFFDERIGEYVAYLRVYSPWRKVVRCVTSDLSKFGPERVVFGYDKQDLASLDKNRFVRMDFYNSSAIRYPYAADAYVMFPSAYYHFPDPPVGKFANDGITEIHMATSPDGVRWTRVSREPFVPLQADENGLYMAWGMIRRGDKLYLYYGVYHRTHGAGMDPRDYITRAELRLDGFVSLDAPSRGTITTVPLVFSGSRLQLNAVAQSVRVALLDEAGRVLSGFGWEDCDAVTGDCTAKTVTWRGKSDLRQLAGKAVRLRVELAKGKLYAFQFAKGKGGPTTPSAR